MLPRPGTPSHQPSRGHIPAGGSHPSLLGMQPSQGADPASCSRRGASAPLEERLTHLDGKPGRRQAPAGLGRFPPWLSRPGGPAKPLVSLSGLRWV